MVQPCNILSLVSALQLHMPRLCSTGAFVAKAAPASLRVANVLRHMATLCDLPMCPKEHTRGMTKVLVAWPWDFSANGCQWNDVAHAWARSDSTMVVCVCAVQVRPLGRCFAKAKLTLASWKVIQYRFSTHSRRSLAGCFFHNSFWAMCCTSGTLQSGRGSAVSDFM